MFIQRTDTIFNTSGSVKTKGTGAITCSWANKQYAGQEEISGTHADYKAFMLIPKISEIQEA